MPEPQVGGRRGWQERGGCLPASPSLAVPTATKQHGRARSAAAESPLM